MEIKYKTNYDETSLDVLLDIISESELLDMNFQKYILNRIIKENSIEILNLIKISFQKM